jgi:2-dehydro-3-deoxyphosphogluconate aldolase / (4S)-4-hydroxy-2-oxoglutarate aldolase
LLRTVCRFAFGMVIGQLARILKPLGGSSDKCRHGLDAVAESLYYRHRHPMTFLDSLRASRLVGILRGVEATELPLVVEACTKSGLEFVEITLNTKEALSKISLLSEISDGLLQVGAGTVLSAAQLRAAVDAGAKFIVSPVLVPEVARAAAELDVPYVPGALTPKEVWDASQAGAAITKVFPIQCFGPSYLRELRGPFGNIPLLACGGIRPDNLREYLEAGADAVALGASSFRREWLATGNVAALIDALSTMVEIATAFDATRSDSIIA